MILMHENGQLLLLKHKMRHFGRKNPQHKQMQSQDKFLRKIRTFLTNLTLGKYRENVACINKSIAQGWNGQQTSSHIF